MSHRTCSVPGCARPAKARLLCSKHYQRAMAGKADLPPRITTADRFWEKVDKNGPVPDFAPHLGPCWIWTAFRTDDGYGKFNWRNGQLAHRYLFEGRIPAGHELDHLCRVRHCVNPDHLEPVTRRENVLRGDNPSARGYRRVRGLPEAVCPS